LEKSFMASGQSLPARQREQEYQNEDSRRKISPGLTPLSLFLVLVLFWVLTKTGLVLVLGLLALLLGTVLEGPVRRLEDRHFPRAAAIATVYVVMIGLVVAMGFLIVPAARDQVDDLQAQLPAQLHMLEDDWRSSSNPILSGPGREFIRTGIDFLEEPASNVTVPDNAAERAIPIVTGVGGAIVSTLTLLVITFYYLLEKKLIRRVIIAQLSEKFQPRVDRLWTEVENKVGGWMRGQLLLCLIIGTIATVSYGIVDLRFWPLLGLWAGITEIIPIVGPWIGGIPAVIVALTQGWQTAVIVAIIIVGMQSLENWFLVPRVMRGAVGLTPLSVFLAILAGTQLMGVAGAVLAIPIAATIQVILTDWLDQRKVLRTADSTPGSGWRWMLNRGIGREHVVEQEPPSEDDGDDRESHVQIVSEQNYPGTDYSVASQVPEEAPVPEEDVA
jgi:predicted PurR-regulated permease PerM